MQPRPFPARAFPAGRAPRRPAAVLSRLAAAAALAAAGAAQAVTFEVVALSGTTALPFASAASSSFGLGLRQVTIADDGWVGFSPSAPGGATAAAFMIGVPGQVLAAASVGSPLDGSAVTTLRTLRVDNGRRVAFTASPAGSIGLQYVSEDLAAAAPLRAAATGIVYNRSTSPNGPIGFELLAGGARLVSAATATGTPYEAGGVDAAGAWHPTVRSSDAASRALPTTGVPGIGTPGAGRTFSSAATVGGNAQGLGFVYGLQTGGGSTIDGTAVRGNLVEVRADGSRTAIVFPGSTVPGAGLPSQGINPALAQFASAGSTLALRADFGRNTVFDRRLSGAILRYRSGADPADSRLSVVALPGATVPGLVSGGNTAVSFGHQVGVDGSGTLAPLSMLPDNLVLDSARGLAVNEGGDIAFVSAVTAAPAAAGYGVFVAAGDGSFRTLATGGTLTAGLAPGVAGASFAKFHDVALNDGGLVVFSATLNGADGRQGYWLGHDAADLQLLAVEGETIEVLPGVFKTVGDLSTSLHELDDTRNTPLDDGLANSGQFAFSVRFTDGSEAVLRTPLAAAVPEPGNAALLLAGLGLGGLGLRRRARAHA